MNIFDNNILSNYSPEWLNHCRRWIPESLSRVFAYSWLADKSYKEERVRSTALSGERGQRAFVWEQPVWVRQQEASQRGGGKLPPRHHWLRYKSVHLLISGVPGLERGRGVGG